MRTPAAIVEDFVSAYYSGDPDRARSYLTDDCHFTGPAAEYRSADDYIRSSAHVAPLVKAVERRKTFADGPDVCVIHDVLLNHSVATLPMVEWYQVRDEKIASIRTFFDTAPFIAASKAGAQASAAAGHVDPVCRMTVREDSAAATRVHEQTTYYFCSMGCAIAFENQPGTYVLKIGFKKRGHGA